MNTRIATLDGLRAIAALGVLWIHSWTLHGNPRLNLLGLDITSILAIGGNGVDLFFVISGFCMYYFYAHKASFSYGDFGKFIKKRWQRLSPAFYVATLLYIVFSYTTNPDFPILKSFFTSVFYLNSILPYSAAGLFWSLGPEWQFYLLIPFILIYQNKKSFEKIFYLILFSLGLVSIASVLVLKKSSDILTDQIMFRYFEFMWGIIVARFITTKTFNLSNRLFWLILFVVLSYVGRFFLTKTVLSLSENYYNLIKIAGFTIMSCGFGGIVYMALTSQKWLYSILGNRVLSTIGRISFSFYLWHGLVHIYIGNWIVKSWPHITDIRMPVITFFISTIVLIPLSLLSFRFLEKPYMSQTKL